MSDAPVLSAAAIFKLIGFFAMLAAIASFFQGWVAGDVAGAVLIGGLLTFVVGRIIER